MQWVEAVWQRAEPVADGVPVVGPQLVVVLAAALVAVGVEPLWRVLRLGVTLVHELGHALVGVAVGRRFTGFVVRGDMSGHAVTSGRPRGPGRVLSVWAGYPAPALLAAVVVWLAGRGWAAPALTAAIAILLVSLVRVRSALTALVSLTALGSAGALWWWRDDVVQAQVLTGVGLVLLVGAWRHLVGVLPSRDRMSDPAVLASLTAIPRPVWNATFLLTCAAATWTVGQSVVTGFR